MRHCGPDRAVQKPTGKAQFRPRTGRERREVGGLSDFRRISVVAEGVKESAGEEEASSSPEGGDGPAILRIVMAIGSRRRREREEELVTRQNWRLWLVRAVSSVVAPTPWHYAIQLRPVKFLSQKELVKLFPVCHSKMEEVIPRDVPVRLVAFNLGYLPGGDKEITTVSGTTLLALEAAARIIEPGGLISAVVYLGHPRGREEFEAIQAFASTEDWLCCKLQMLNRPLAPVPFFMLKR